MEVQYNQDHYLCYNLSNQSFPFSCDCVTLKPDSFHNHKGNSSFLPVIIVIPFISLNLMLFCLWLAYIKWFPVCPQAPIEVGQCVTEVDTQKINNLI